MWRGRISQLHKFSQVQVHTGTYWYILVRTGTYYENTANFIWSRSILPPAPTSLSRTLGLALFHTFLPRGGLLHCQTTQARLFTAKVPQPSVDLVHVAATPAISSCRVCTAHGKSWTLVLASAELVWDCRGWVASQLKMSEIYQYIAVHTSMYKYIPVHTSTYLYVLVHTSTYKYVLVCTSTYLLRYVQVQRGIYQYILVCTCVLYVLVHTRTYQYVLVWRNRYWWQYILVCTSTY